MGFYEKYCEAKNLPFEDIFLSRTKEDVERVLQKTILNESDYLTLLSPAAESCIEEMAKKAQQLTTQHFGKAIQVFAPLYISDYCVNQCKYCSFSIINEFPRKKLTMAQIEAEAKTIAETGIKHVLIVTGESYIHASIEYLKECITVLKNYFDTISIEVHPLRTEEYQELVEHGIFGLIVHQEVYNEDIYAQIHVKGPKRNYLFRIDTPERGCQAGMRKVSIGALLGLDDWRKENFFSGLHANYIRDNYPETEIGIAFPRIRPNLGDFQPSIDVTDKNLIQSILAMRLFLPKAGITLSTRERPALRDDLIHLGITTMSAASSTAVGGYSNKQDNNSQFEISDERSVDEILALLRENDYQPV